MKKFLAIAFLLYLVPAGAQTDALDPSSGYGNENPLANELKGKMDFLNMFIKELGHGDTYTTPKGDLEKLRAEDQITDQHKELPWRFGEEYMVALSAYNSGKWSLLENGEACWHLNIHCTEATSVSLVFSKFKLPEGAELIVYSEDREQVLGPFTKENNKKSGILATSLIYNDHIVVELHVQQDLAADVELEIGKVVHGYRSLLKRAEDEAASVRGPFGNSGDCNINVNCPEGADWQIEKRSVALIVDGGFSLCTGALVNNTAQDGTPYFLTANHCLIGNTASWVFYFNHENNDCTGSTGPTTDSVSGAEEVASDASSDFALLLLDDTPPADFDVIYAGWDNSDDEDTNTSAVGIHHPSGDVKKICFEEDAPYHSFQDGANVWFIDQWELGVTEGGSSGSPLFNQNHQIIGQLYGGASACNGDANNGLFDYYGRFGESWDGPSASARLKDWLDPEGTGATTLASWPESFNLPDNDAGIQSITNLDEASCAAAFVPVVVLRNYGELTLASATIHYAYNNGAEITFNWAGNLLSGMATNVDLGLMTLDEGTNNIQVWVSEPNGVVDENPINDERDEDFNSAAGVGQAVTVVVMTDEFPEESTWEIVQDGDVVAESGVFVQAESLYESTVCLSAGCYDFVMLDDYGDGLCCDYGIGYYEVLDQSGNVLASGGEFEDEDVTEICVEVGVGEKSLNALVVLPNPTAGTFSVVLPTEGVHSFKLYDLQGRVAVVWQVKGNAPSFDISTLADGVYMLEYESAEGAYINRIVKRSE